MVNEQDNAQESDLPRSIGSPARNALIFAGYTRLEQLNGLSEAEILRLHGVGPKAIRLLKGILESKGWAFAIKTNGNG